MRRTFLTLVRSGLWNTPVDPTPFSSMNSADWEEIYQLARTQALLAITFDGVLSLPAELRPPRPLYLQWAAKVVQIEQSNLRLNEELPEVFMPYREAGLHPILLKGQGIATHYINPLHRQCGDIDVYIGKEGQQYFAPSRCRGRRRSIGQTRQLFISWRSYRKPSYHPAD